MNKSLINWPDTVLLYGAFFQHTKRLNLKWRDCDRQWSINVLALTAKQIMELEKHYEN
ncbi:hypothetical protein [Photobacterium phosphoreum]|uniref:hypothetical protein n=1 Tax=Photobacterium phosphoreum TaxID=659 RepID=UPI0015E78EB3|nr:hypothetical protein [Photobacterium phosphoreum]